ncbi:LANO_0E14268g1_1 [Lachancea nothofagi CBS 11611]|uniref:LANO_0E14268g1_1 n=1 Tax=Lachancea nothofagi CBS 11611 TaxID=1266666 RepID=A0A1G4JZU1_9SACH|nr:LANO_0E14268g1_1 [Lachancea nothofagi CBS 11611]
MSVTGVDSKLFSTPVKNVSGEKFRNVREKIGRESPYLYRSKHLSEVGKDNEGNSGSGPQPGPNKVSNDIPQNDRPAESAVTSFAFENPVLEQYSRRIVNKELETRRIISNFLALLLWNLGVKFLELFLHHTSHGIGLQRKLSKWVQELLIYRLYPHADLDNSQWVRNATLTNVSHVFHLVIFYNVIVSLWRLLVKSQNVKIDDLRLNHRQKQLLGVSDTPVTNKLLPQVTLANRDHPKSQVPHLASNSGTSESHVSPSTSTFLFKSLQTPMKSREQNSASVGVRSEYVKKINAFGELRNPLLKKTSLTPSQNSTNPLMTPINRNGYIPSSKYAYMRDSPSPRKRL